ncbi:MAG: ABC transporter permease [Lachnospiraceae bacterium]|nr:ABC transporter permease [Lachnospiraceae bacterium]
MKGSVGKDIFAKMGYELVLLGFLAIWFLFMGVMEHSFLALNNIVTVLTRVSEVAIIAVGMTVVIIAGGFDLSVGTVMAIVPIIIGLSYGNGFPFGVCIFYGILSAVAIGIVNGILIAKAGFQPIIGTLATMTALRSIIYVLTDGKPVSTFPSGYDQLAQGKLLGIPIPILILLAIIIAAQWMMRCTKYGRFIYATGGNPKATDIAGISVVRITIAVYVLNALLAGVAGIIFSSRLISASPDAGRNTAFDVVTAVLMGGTSINGGQGNILGTMLGILILNFIINGFNLLGVNAYWQMIFMGIVLLIAIGYDAKLRNGFDIAKFFKHRKG